MQARTVALAESIQNSSLRRGAVATQGRGPHTAVRERGPQSTHPSHRSTHMHGLKNRSLPVAKPR
jgi:hypothetical protein